VIVPASADVSSSAIQHDDAAVELMRERFDRLFAGGYATGIRPDEVNWVAGRDPDDHTRQICNGWKADPEIARHVLAERTGRLAAEFMRWDGVQILQDNCIWKPPKTTSLGMHQDEAYLDYLVPPEMITMNPSSTIRKPSRSKRQGGRLSSRGSSGRQFLHQASLGGPEPGRGAGGGILPRVVRTRRGWDDDVNTRIGERPFEERLRPRLDAERLELLRIRAGHQGSRAAQRPHRDHTEIDLGGEWQDPFLCFALNRVVGHLDRVDPAGSHHPLELAERRGLVVRRSEQPNVARLSLAFEPIQTLLPGDQVVHLFEVHPPGEPTELSLELVPGLGGRGRPDLGGDKGLVPPLSERSPEHSFSPAVHGRRVDDTTPGRERRVHDVRRLRFLRGRKVEGQPGSEADHRQLEP
jgi:hypothetical protein